MRILDVRPLQIPDVKVVKFARFRDQRGYFTEPYRAGTIAANADLRLLGQSRLVQLNESFSRAGVLRGLHFQWNPFMGKLVRTISGHMVDLFLDIRRDSPTLGKIAAFEMRADQDADSAEWIWVPPGFAHGNFFLEPTVIEYGCTGEYSPGCEAGISPLADDLDWSACDAKLRQLWESHTKLAAFVITDKDRAGLTLAAWLADPRSENFRYEQLTEQP